MSRTPIESEHAGRVSASPEVEPEGEGRSLAPPRFALTADGGDAPPNPLGVAQMQLGDEAETDAAAGPEWQSFAESFNNTFRSVLHVFRGEDMVQVGPSSATGANLTAADLMARFSDRQRRLLMDFMTTNIIPDHLFNGDDNGASTDATPTGLTAQERILMSGHILRVGQYQPGSFSQRMYARMCYHWVQLVHHYAGATRDFTGSAGGIMGNFDHAGNAVFGTGEVGRDDHWEGHMHRFADDADFMEMGADGGMSMTAHGDAAMRAAESGDERRFRTFGRRDTMSMEQLGRIQPGDWIWYYVGNASGIGGHSVIFSHWASDVLEGPNGRYRRAVCFSQNRPEDGGNEHYANIGENFAPAPYHIYPVINWMHMSEDAHTATTLEEMLVGSGEMSFERYSSEERPDLDGLSSENAAYILQVEGRARPRGRRVDLEAVKTHLRSAANGFLASLSGTSEEVESDAYGSHLTATQRETLQNGINDGDLETLVLLYQRLSPMSANADALDSDVGAARARVETNHATRLEDYNTRIAEFETEVEALEREVKPMFDEMVIRARAFGEIMGLSFYREQSEALHQAQLRVENGSPRDQDFLDNRRNRLAIFRLILQRSQNQGTRTREQREKKREMRAVRTMVRGYDYRLTNQDSAGARIRNSMPHHTVHAPGSGGAGIMNRRPSGRLSEVLNVRAMNAFLITPSAPDAGATAE